MASRIPLILCGKTKTIGQGVAAGLKPEYEGTSGDLARLHSPQGCASYQYNATVIHFILTPDDGVANIPALLRGERPPRADTSDVGSQNYAATPAAVVTGGGYDQADVARMRDACDETCKKVPWLRPDLNKPAPPLGPAYGAAMLERTKACLKALAERGEMGDDGVHFF